MSEISTLTIKIPLELKEKIKEDADKQFATTTLDELLAFSESELEAISGRLLRSLLIIEYMKQQRLPISATLDSDAPSGQIVTING